MVGVGATYHFLSYIKHIYGPPPPLIPFLAIVLLTIDEMVDGGRILEIDSANVIERVTMKGVEGIRGLGAHSVVEMTVSDE